MLKIAAFLVIAFFVTLWATGNNLTTFRAGLVDWAGGNGELIGASHHSGDWGS